jgi:hypothetical protein
MRNAVIVTAPSGSRYPTSSEKFKIRKKFTHPYSFALTSGVVVFLPHTLPPGGVRFVREIASLNCRLARVPYIRSLKHISMFLSDTQIAAFKRASKRTGLKVSELIRRFIDQGLKRS